MGVNAGDSSPQYTEVECAKKLPTCYCNAEPWRSTNLIQMRHCCVGDLAWVHSRFS